MSSFQEALVQLPDQNVYLHSEPDVLDFTSKKRPARWAIHTKDFSLQVPFVENDLKTNELISQVQAFIGGEKAVIVTWNLKNILSYVLGRTGANFRLEGRIYDLAFLESYFGESKPRPTSFAEAFSRLAQLVKKSDWQEVYKTYQQVYLPLIQSIPEIETCGATHRKKKARVFSYYEIDGQANGRLKCSNLFSSAFNPHNMGPDERENLRAPFFDWNFMYFDYKHMEASVLQWLSQDDYMGEILASGEDFYGSLWKAITRQEGDDARSRCKESFLPVVYGMGSEGLSQRLQWPLDVCKQLLDRMNKTMPIAFNWIKKQSESLVDGIAIDRFRRRRYFDNAYKSRNFFVQSPAALICSHKLLQLMEAIKGHAVAAAYIHDGFVVYVKPDNARRTYEVGKKALEAEHELYPGLKLKVGCKWGPTLETLKEIK